MSLTHLFSHAVRARALPRTALVLTALGFLTQTSQAVLISITFTGKIATATPDNADAFHVSNGQIVGRDFTLRYLFDDAFGYYQYYLPGGELLRDGNDNGNPGTAFMTIAGVEVAMPTADAESQLSRTGNDQFIADTYKTAVGGSSSDYFFVQIDKANFLPTNHLIDPLDFQIDGSYTMSTQFKITNPGTGLFTLGTLNLAHAVEEPVPEPCSLLAFAGLAGLIGRRRVRAR